MPAKTCAGRVVVITGAGNSIGRAHALAFAAKGAKVVVNDLGGARDGGGGSSSGPAQAVADEITAAGGQAVANTEDISSWAGAQRLIGQTVETFGGLDVVVNNAGILRDRMIVTMTEPAWDAVIGVHLKGTFASDGAPGNQMEGLDQTHRSGEPGSAGQLPLEQPAPQLQPGLDRRCPQARDIASSSCLGAGPWSWQGSSRAGGGRRPLPVPARPGVPPRRRLGRHRGRQPGEGIYSLPLVSIDLYRKSRVPRRRHGNHAI